MASLAQIKRSIDVGTRVTLTHQGEYGPGDTLAWGKNVTTLPLTREVAIKRTNAIAFADPQANDERSWMYWPRASEVEVIDERSFTVGRSTYVIEDDA